ncbi:hypothetical protein P7K49_022993, partial [Saguinus oedipus]
SSRLRGEYGDLGGRSLGGGTADFREERRQIKRRWSRVEPWPRHPRRGQQRRSREDPVWALGTNKRHSNLQGAPTPASRRRPHQPPWGAAGTAPAAATPGRELHCRHRDTDPAGPGPQQLEEEPTATAL